MNGNVNMFSAKKVRLHGMTSAKWTTKDKISQYKGLINLYTRDRKIIDSDSNVNKKKTVRELKDLAKKVHTDRDALDNAIRGDKQNLRNTLSEHKELQLAYQNSQPKTVIEEIDQLNFNRRKVLDKLLYEKKKKSRILIDLKLEQALLEDRLKYAFLGQIKEEKEAQIITGKVQDASLRREAAYTIYHIYNEMLDIMKKDALYFDVIIATVTNDGYHQSKCFLGATKLGQLATEYLDDRRQEYDTLEKMILKDMATRKIDLKILNEQVENAASSLKQLLRKDSDANACVIHITESESVQGLQKDIKEVEKTLKFLKGTTLVNSYEAIYPCLTLQLDQNRRLKHLAKMFERDRDIILNKTNHAEVMKNFLTTTVNDDIAQYLHKKKELSDLINHLKEQTEHCTKILRYKRDSAVKIRVALRQLLQLSYNLKSAEAMKKPTASPHPFSIAVDKQKKMEIPPEDEVDGTKIISIINGKFATLMSAYFAEHSEALPDEAFKNFETVMQERMIVAHRLEMKLSESSLLKGLYVEASQQMTREEIKKQSAEIVATNTKNQDLVPLFPAPLKTKSHTKHS